MVDFPRSSLEFERRFGDEAACAAHLASLRWPEGFRCAACGYQKGWALTTKAFTWECASCHHQTSLTAGTVMHRSKQPLTVWFKAAWLMTTTANGISALELQKQLDIPSYKTAWLLCAKLRKTMVNAEDSPFRGLVGPDEINGPQKIRDHSEIGEQSWSIHRHAPMTKTLDSIGMATENIQITGRDQHGWTISQETANQIEFDNSYLLLRVKNCHKCGNDFFSHWNCKYCSPACRNSDRTRKTTAIRHKNKEIHELKKHCQICGSLIRPRRKTRLYCSNTCAQRAHRMRVSKNLS